MSPNPETFLRHLQKLGYHSRSDKHSNALAEAIVADLMASCPAMARKARDGRLVYDLNFTIQAGTSDWNVDLVLGLRVWRHPPKDKPSSGHSPPPFRWPLRSRV